MKSGIALSVMLSFFFMIVLGEAFSIYEPRPWNSRYNHSNHANSTDNESILLTAGGEKI